MRGYLDKEMRVPGEACSSTMSMLCHSFPSMALRVADMVPVDVSNFQSNKRVEELFGLTNGGSGCAHGEVDDGVKCR